MIIDDIQVDRDADATTLRGRVRWANGSDEIAFTVPTELAVPGTDATPLLTTALLAAMAAHEDLVVDGPVSGRLLARLPVLTTAYAAWDRSLRVPHVTAAATAEVPEANGADRRVASFFSRGIDSTFAAAVDRSEPGPVDLLVYCTGFDPSMTAPTIEADRELARKAAGLLDIPLVSVDVRAQTFTNRFRHWGDAHGAVLAAVAQVISGGVSTMLIPGTDSFDSLLPYGSHPITDRLYSTEWTEILHDEILLSRVQKTGLIASQRPDLLPFLKVCYSVDRTDNCGVCGKCIIAMTALQAAGALGDATGFPSQIDLDAVRALRMNPIQTRFHWTAVIEALGPDGVNGEVRGALLEALRRNARPPLRQRATDLADSLRGRRGSAHPSWREKPGFDWLHQSRVIRTLDEGKPFPDVDLDHRPPLPGFDLRQPDRPDTT